MNKLETKCLLWLYAKQTDNKLLKILEDYLHGKLVKEQEKRYLVAP